MRTSIIVLVVLAMGAVAIAAPSSYSNDFEGYGAYAATVNNGSLWFNAANGDGSYATDGWMPYWSWGAQRDDLQISATGGPHGAGNPSGYGNSLGLTNFDGTNAHGIARAIDSVVDLAGGDTVELSIKVNASAQAAGGTSALYVGGPYLVSAGSPDNFSGITFNSSGAGSMVQNPLGAEPALTGLAEAVAGWAEIKLVIYSAYHGGYEFDTTHMDVLSGPIGGPLTLRGTYGASSLYTPTHIALNPNLGTTYDDLSIVVTPEPATMILLGLGGLVLRRRRAA
jgi:hypothetical protein